jgi:phenylpropionate dioxygenase-like ring-hydroxylating dioxygenase large terminal subunit
VSVCRGRGGLHQARHVGEENFTQYRTGPHALQKKRHYVFGAVYRKLSSCVCRMREPVYHTWCDAMIFRMREDTTMNVRAIQGNLDPLAALGTDPIPAAPYYREEYFALEREAIFRRCWLQIGHTCELPEPGSFIVRSLDVANVSVLITRDKEGVIRAFHNVCTHRGTTLVSKDSGKAAHFTCRYHAWTFGNDGHLRSAPDFEKFYINKESCHLRTIAAEVCAGLIFINLAKKPAHNLRDYLCAIAEQLEDLPVARATTFAEYVYDIRANWKLTFDNFQENYHLRFIHPRSGAGGMGIENPFGYPTNFNFHGLHRTETLWFNPNPTVPPVAQTAWGKGHAFAAADGFGDSAYFTDYFCVFPNFFMLGTPTQHFSHSVIPVGPSQSRGVVRMYWIGDDDSASKRFAREYAMASVLDIHAEDRAVIEAGQEGLSSGALEHIHFQAQEVLCRHQYVSVQSMVDAYQAELRHDARQ